MDPIAPTIIPLTDFAALAEVCREFCEERGWSGHVKREPMNQGSPELTWRLSMIKGDQSVSAIVGDELVSIGGLFLLTRATYDAMNSSN